jgi:hypothetical protein
MHDSQQTTKRRILVFASASAEDSVLYEAIRDRVRESEAEVLVVATALDSGLGHRTSGEDEAFGEAVARLRRCLDLLGAAGIEANGLVGDGDPLQAIADVLQGFPADELVLATHAAARSAWLSRRVHVVVDPGRGANSRREGLAVGRRLH